MFASKLHSLKFESHVFPFSQQINSSSSKVNILSEIRYCTIRYTNPVSSHIFQLLIQLSFGLTIFLHFFLRFLYNCRTFTVHRYFLSLAEDSFAGNFSSTSMLIQYLVKGLFGFTARVVPAESIDRYRQQLDLQPFRHRYVGIWLLLSQYFPTLPKWCLHSRGLHGDMVYLS